MKKLLVDKTSWDKQNHYFTPCFTKNYVPYLWLLFWVKLEFDSDHFTRNSYL